MDTGKTMALLGTSLSVPYPPVVRGAWPALVLSALLTATGLTAGAADGIERVSLAPDGSETRRDSLSPSLSGDGRLVAFISEAGILVPGDTNRSDDVFVRNTVTGKTRRVSVSTRGAQAAPRSFFDRPSISSNGKFVAFGSDAPNLVPKDTNRTFDVFLHNLKTGRTRRVSIGPSGRQGNGPSFEPSISGDGHLVVFQSNATNLTRRRDRNHTSDIFVRNLKNRTTRRVSVSSTERQAAGLSWGSAISRNGRIIAFLSQASNLVKRDTNKAVDVFVRDRRRQVTRRVSLSSKEAQGNKDSGATPGAPALSGDGHLVAFASSATNLVGDDSNRAEDIFLRNRSTGRTRRVSVGPQRRQANNDSDQPALSANGCRVAFLSLASNLDPRSQSSPGAFAIWDLFSRNRCGGVTREITVGIDGAQADDSSGAPSLSAKGSRAAFHSFAGNLVTDDTNFASDVFLVILS
jgi:Tol biopolymer transport system component